ncbi:MAG: M14 family metallopeptidase, partial [Burkholderiales bacterium]
MWSRTVVGVIALSLVAAPAAAQLRLVQVPISGRAGLDSLARLGFEVADVRILDGAPHAVIVVSPETEAPLRRAGYIPQDVALGPLAAVAAADTYRVYRSFEKPLTGIRATLEAWAAADTALDLDSIGSSVEGRPILAVKLGDAADSPARPNVLFMGTHHAREWVAAEMAMKLLRWLADSLPSAVRASRDIWVIPVENPDGYQYTFMTERLWRKNRRPNGDGTFGVDPNRNYPAFWGLDDAGSSGAPGSEVYRGTGPASEPETRAIVAFHAAHPPAVSVSYHTFSGLVLHPYGFRTGELAPDQPVFTALAGTDLFPAVRDSVPASTIAYYHPGPGWHLYPTNGEYTEWAYRAHGSIAFTPELTSGCCTPVGSLYYGFEFPDDSGMV